MKQVLITLLFLTSLSAIAQNTKVFLIGDSGEPKFPEDSNLKFLGEKLDEATENDVLIFLGDNIYPRGLPDPESPLREIMEKKLNAQLDVMKAFKGTSYIIPGNHDWAKSKKQGWNRVLNQQKYVDQYLGNTSSFLPRGGCPGPVELPVNPNLTIVIMDLQYIVHNWDKPSEDGGCLAASITGMMIEMQDIIERNKNKHIMVVAHHPMYTYGVHGGATSWKDHIFPLTLLNEDLYIPLPVIGSIYPVFRKYIGSIQDISHPKIRAIRKRLVEILSIADNVVYANGHEHSLEYIKRHNMHFVVSGSGSKITRVREGLYTEFSAEVRGFAAVEFTESGTANLSFWNGDSQEELYHEKIYEKEIITEQQKIFDRPDFENKTITTSASKSYKARGLKKLLMGDNYRDVWAEEIEVPVFDILSERGGLNIVKKGGGMQTRSLRLEAGNEKQYVLRSIEKYAENAIPEALRKTFAAELVQDQISASHPYGALVVPYLAEAAGIYHTNPTAVYIPEDPYLGRYMGAFAGLMALYEERPNNASAEEEFFGKGEKIKSTFDVIDELRDDNDNRVDEAFVVRNRLFDMMIGDWDRHDDQWRWVRVKDPDGKGDLYRPIPRDRDQAFFVNEGLIPNIVSRKWALPKVEGFDEKVRWAPGLSNNARYFDRTFMTMPDWGTWQQEVKFLQETLTDSVIENSIAQWPDEIYTLTGEETIRILKARRDDMMRYAREHYLFLSKEVEVTGSDKDELFEVERLDNDSTRVRVYKIGKDDEKSILLYDRTFLAEETREIRLFGLSGKDIFQIDGAVDKGIRVSVLGGRKKDKVTDNSTVGGASKKTRVYDKSVEVKKSGETKVILAEDNEEFAYNRKSFKYDILMPQLSVQINPDDGLFLGAGFIYTKNNWRKRTYAARHNFLVNAAFATGSYSIDYNASFTEVLGDWGLELEAINQTPYFVNNFFGLGNDTSFDFEGDGEASDFENPIQFYRIRTDRNRYSASLFRNFGTQSRFSFGPLFRTATIDDDDDNFLLSTASGIDIDKVRKPHSYLGGQANILLDSRDNKVLTHSGTKLEVGASHLRGLNDRSENLTRLAGSFSLFITPRATNFTFATRAGFEHIIGDFEFFNAATLGGRSNLRGFRRTRFYGETAFYNNIDLRLKLFSFRSYLFPAKVGILAFHDVGRVWLDGEVSDTWHRSLGFGLWLAPANAVIFSVNYGITEEENLPSVTFGFLF